MLLNDYLDIGKTLVIAPKRVIEDTWPSEFDKWDHLKGIRFSLIAGSPKQRMAAIKEKADVYMISRDNIVWLVDLLKDYWDYDTLIIDELSSFKNHASKRFKKLKTVTPYFKRVIGLTGTPAPNSYLDLWAQVYLLDRGERLGKNITAYRRKYFNAYSRGMYTDYQIKDGAKKEIDEKLSEICISMKAKDYLDLKDPIVIDKKAKLNPAERKLYKEMEKEAIAEIDENQIVALSAAVVTNKLMQIANGNVYDEDGNTHLIHKRKIEVLEELVAESQDENILVFYNFKSDQDSILAKFPEAVQLEDEKDIKAWNEGKIKMLIAHPASAGHGLNLQNGGSIIVWYGLTWSLELYLQANARLQRQGQKNTVRVYRILAEGTIDERVVKVLEGKHISQEQLLRELKAEVR